MDQWSLRVQQSVSQRRAAHSCLCLVSLMLVGAALLCLCSPAQVDHSPAVSLHCQLHIHTPAHGVCATCQDVVLVPPCLSAKALLLVGHRRRVRQAVGGPDLRWAVRVGELSGCPAAPIPSPVLSHGVGSLEGKARERTLSRTSRREPQNYSCCTRLKQKYTIQ